MNNERFTVPELLFRPDDIGAYPEVHFSTNLVLAKTGWCIIDHPHRYIPDIDNPIIGLDQAGLPATIAHSISLLPSDLQGMFWANIGLIGGNAKFQGFRERLSVPCPPVLANSLFFLADHFCTNRMSELQTLAPVDYEVGIYECEK
jgi:actin-related protein 6